MIKEQEIPKYLKQKESNVSKARKKSKHKHQYEECLIQYHFKSRFEKSENIHTSLSSYCIICGKRGGYLKNGKYHIELEKIEEEERYKGKPYYRSIPDEEIYERYYDKLPIFFIDDIFKNEYVDLHQEEN